MKKNILIIAAFLMGVSTTAPAQVCFTPYQRCTALLVNTINHAKHSIDVQSYTFTSKRIARALVNAEKRGVKVRVILDKSQFDPRHFSQMKYLKRHGIPIWKDDQLNIAHNKVMIIDRHIVETGSFNYTVSAQKHNAENMLIINDRVLAIKYLKNWRRRKLASVRVS